MRLSCPGVVRLMARSILCLIVMALAIAVAVPSLAADNAAPRIPGAEAAEAPAASGGGDMMKSAGWLERITMKLEAEAMSDVSMLPDTTAALVREWRSL